MLEAKSQLLQPANIFQYFLEKYRPVVHDAAHINFKDKHLSVDHFYRFNICESRFGRSLVATENIAKGEVIACLPAVFLTDRIQRLSIEINEVVHEINLGEHLYPLLRTDNKTLWQFSHMSTFLDHACWPACNARCDGHKWQSGLLNYSLTALHDIVSGEHISVDYATIEYHADHAAQMHCACQTSECRKHYCGFVGLPDELKKVFTDKNLLEAPVAFEIWKRLESAQADSFAQCYKNGRPQGDAELFDDMCLVGEHKRHALHS